VVAIGEPEPTDGREPPAGAEDPERYEFAPARTTTYPDSEEDLIYIGSKTATHRGAVGESTPGSMSGFVATR
jgi:hypothetical protein